jgi:uroporphyrin-3 C-methyltransferase
MMTDEQKTNEQGPEEAEKALPADEMAGADQPSTPGAAADTAAPGSGRGLGIVALLAALVALAASGYLWYRVEVLQRIEQGMTLATLGGDLKVTSQGLATVEKQQAKIAERQDQLDATIKSTIKEYIQPLQAQQGELTSRQKELMGSLEKVYQDLDRNLDSFALEEVEQLLRIANHSAALAGDAGTALTALQLADRRLQDLGNPGLLEVRKQIGAELTQLKSVEPVDLPGIAVRLSNMSRNVEQLPLLNEPDRLLPSGGDPAATAQTPDDDDAWMRAGRELLADLRNLVRIQNVSESAKPLLTPEQRYFLFNNLKVMLSGSQIAALRKDSATFRSNLDQAKQWLQEYFDTEQHAVRQLIADIDELSKVDLAPPLPDISGSLTALKDIKQEMGTQ